MSVLFANAIDVINTLSAAHTKGTLKSELRRYLTPSLLVLDEVGYLPIDQRGADLLFQVNPTWRIQTGFKKSFVVSR
jgi:DNA replication protein DnaC